MTNYSDWCHMLQPIPLIKQKINEKNFKNPQRGISRAEKDIEKAKDNFYEQMNKIEKKMENFNSSFDEVCAGIITFD